MAADPKSPPPKRRTRTSDEVTSIIGVATLVIGFALCVFLMVRGCAPGLFGR